MSFDLSQYEPVEERIKRFYADHEDGRILTELLSDANNIATAVVMAHVYVGDIEKATGLAFEKFGEGYVNKTSHLENCETSAIGRALANFNYTGNKRPSREEMQKATPKPKDPERDKLIKEIADEINKHTFTEQELAMYREEVKKSPTDKLGELLDEIRNVGKNVENKPVVGKEPKEELF